jgi:hypothetical protein
VPAADAGGRPAPHQAPQQRRTSASLRSAIGGDAAAALEAQAVKRVAIRFVAKRTATWDHRKLGGSY